MMIKKILFSSLILLNSLLLFLAILEDRIDTPSWLQVFGRMHPALLHFPIVLALLYLTITLLAPAQFIRDSRWNVLTENLLLIAALSSTITALMGFFLSKDGGYEDSTISLHKWTGMAIPFVLFFMYVFRAALLKKLILARTVSAAIVVLVVIAAHYGGVVTHGENFVLAPITPEKKRLTPSIEEAVVYADLVQPVLEEKCISCHNSKKAKGELIMETQEELLKGGKNGKLWDSAKADLGLMMQRVHMPLENKKHMPPAGKPQLTNDELVILESWIRGGADFQKRVMELTPTDTLMVMAKKRLKTASERNYEFPPADEELVENLSNSNRAITSLALESPALKVNFYNSSLFKSSAIKELESIAQQVVDINLAGMPVKDEDLKALRQFKNLHHLNLNYTDVTGKTLGELQALPDLRVLSLAGTKVDFASLRVLQQLPKLNTVYLWNTSVQNGDIEELKKIDKRISYQSGFYGDTTVMKLPPPILLNEEDEIDSSMRLQLKHNINGAEIRYTLNGTDPDSISSPIYKDTIQLRSFVEVKARAFKKGWISSDLMEKYFYKNTYRPDTAWLLNKVEDEDDPPKDVRLVFDGERSDINRTSNKWLSHDEKIQVMCAFKKTVTVRNVIFSGMSELINAIFPPEEVQVWGGDEKNRLRLLKTVRLKQPTELVPAANIHVECNFSPVNVKFLKFVISPVRKIPKWHGSRGDEAAAYVDEIYIN